LYCLNLPFGQLWEGKFVFCSCTRKDWLTDKGKFVSGISCKSAPFVPNRGVRIKRYQGQISIFAVSMEFCSLRRFSLSTHCRSLMSHVTSERERPITKQSTSHDSECMSLRHVETAAMGKERDKKIETARARETHKQKPKKVTHLIQNACAFGI